MRKGLTELWKKEEHLYLQGYASYIKDSMIAELCDMDRSLMLSIDILPVPTDEAVRERLSYRYWEKRMDNAGYSAHSSE